MGLRKKCREFMEQGRTFAVDGWPLTGLEHCWDSVNAMPGGHQEFCGCLVVWEQALCKDDLVVVKQAFCKDVRL